MVKKMLIGIAGLVVALLIIIVGGGLLIDGKLVVNAEQPLKTSPAQLYPLLSSVSGLGTWWKQVPDASTMVMKKKSGPDEGVGMVIAFESADGKMFETWTLLEA